MENKHIDTIINNNKTLVNTTEKLVGIASQTLSLVRTNQDKKEQLLDICIQIYQGLYDKTNRNIAEESWYAALHKAIRNKI